MLVENMTKVSGLHMVNIAVSNTQKLGYTMLGVEVSYLDWVPSYFMF